MNVEVVVRPQATDAIVGGWLMARSKPVFLAVFLAFFVGLPWSYVLLVLLFGANGRTPTVVEMGLLPILTLLLFFGGLPLASYRASKRSPAFGDVVHRITDAGITSVGKGWDRTVEWPAITACTAWRGALLLRSGAQGVLLLPARSLTPDLVARIRDRLRHLPARRGD